MEQTGITLGDAMNLCNQQGGYNGMWNNPFMYLVWMSLFGNGAFGGWGNRNSGETIESAKADIIQNTQAVNDAQTLSQQVRGIANGIADGFSSSTYALNNSLKDNAYNLTNAIGNVANNVQMGFCQTNHNIDNLKYENAKNTGDIINANNTNTQKVLDKLCCMVADAKDNQIADLRQQLSASQLAFSQQAQNNYLIEKLKTTA